MPEKDLDTWELFDLADDKQELSNIHGNKDYRKIQKHLEKELIRLPEQFKVVDD